MMMYEWVNIWMDTYIVPCRAASTASGYRYALRHVAQLLDVDLQELSPLVIQRALNALSSQFPRQAQIAYAALHACLRKAVFLGLIAASPMDKVEKPRHEKRDISYLTTPEAAAVIAAAEQLPAYKAILMMCLLGLRIGEALGQRGSDFQNGVLLVRRQKLANGTLAPLKSKASRRNIPVPDVLLMVLAPADPNDYVCECSRKKVAEDLTAACKSADCQRVTPHGLRHTFASMAIHDGTNMRVLP